MTAPRCPKCKAKMVEVNRCLYCDRCGYNKNPDRRKMRLRNLLGVV